jgi:small subunit ribosomal protein S9
VIDEPQDNETSEQPDTPEEETPVAEGTDAPSAGEVAEETPASEAAAEDAEPAPVAEENSEQVEEPVDAEEAPADQEEETLEDESPAKEEPAAEAGPEEEGEEAEELTKEPVAEQKPAAEKKDVIPGADLEPIAVEPAAPQLSAEEQARLEAEEEERARREAELAAADESSASRAPATIEDGKRFIATGKRKRSIARVTVVAGDGKFVVNKRSLEEFFPRPLHQTMARQALASAGYEGNVDVSVRVHGGGISGQAGAVRHGIARALTEVDPELRGDLKRRGFLTRDARVKERRKAGFKKARKKPQFSKR